MATNFQLNVKVNGVDTAVSTIGQLEQALASTKDELKDIQIGSTAFDSLTKQARTLQGQLELNGEKLTNFNGNLDEISQSVGRLGSSIAAGFAVATSALSIFGEEGEELTQAQIKAQQALAIAFGATTIATNAAKIAQDIKTVTDKLAVVQTNLLAAAVGRDALVKAADAVATGTATTAQLALNAAMTANPVLLLVTALGALIAAFTLFGDSTEKAVEGQEDLNRELERSEKAYSDNIATQKDLLTAKSKLAEFEAKTEVERLKIKSKTQAELDELDLKDLKNKEKNINSKLSKDRSYLDLQTIYVRDALQKQSELQDFNVDRFLNVQQLELKSVIQNYDARLISADQYYDQLLAIDRKYNKDQKSIDRRADLKDLEAQQSEITNAIKVAEEERIANEKVANAEIKKAQTENYKTRLQELKDFNKDVKDLNEDRLQSIIDLERELEDISLDRISLVKGKDDVYREDLIASYDETIEKLKSVRDRGLADAQSAFTKELESFRESQKARLDDNNNRVVSDKQIEAEIAKQKEAFANEQVLRAKVTNEKIVLAEADKKNQILEIDQILQNELTFGNNNSADSKKQIELDYLDFLIDQNQRQLALEESNQEQLLALIGKQNQERIALETAALKQKLLTLYQEELKTLQGTAEQKAEQGKRLEKKYQDDLAKIDADADLKKKEASKQTEDDIFNYKVQKLQEYSAIASSFLNAGLQLAGSINELQKVNLDNQLMAIRDNSIEAKNVVIENYNEETAALEQKFNTGQITQEQYNNSINDLNQKLAKSTDDLDKKQKDAELKAKKKQFESDKKLKIAQAIISGAQGAVSAFTGAMQLGPIAGPIVGAILAAAVGVTTGIQVAAIKKTKFDGGGGDIATANTPSSASGVGGAAAIADYAGGGNTQFSAGLLGAPGGGQGFTGGSGAPGMQKVYVVESDITNSQNKVKVLEGGSSFG